jgi:hypothetical protein
MYAIVKGFTGEYAHIQRNAIRSWQAVCPDAQVVLFGDTEVGAQQEAAMLGVPVLPMAYTDYGVPVLCDVIERAHAFSQSGTRCLVNADIILEPRFPDAVRTVEREFRDEFLLVTRRHNVQLGEELDFSGDWHGAVRALHSVPYTRGGIDVFCYRGGWLADVPPFAVGRMAWDNWIVGIARAKDVPIVEATKFTVAYHQEHYKVKPREETAINRDLLDAEMQRNKDFKLPGTLDSAGWELTEDGEIVDRS